MDWLGGDEGLSNTLRKENGSAKKSEESTTIIVHLEKSGLNFKGYINWSTTIELLQTT